MPKLGRSKAVNLITLEARLIAEIITPLDLPPEEQAWVKEELQWLFKAVENLLQVYRAAQQRLKEEELGLIRKFSLKIQRDREMKRLRPQIWREEVSKSPPIAASIPPQAERLSQADNKLLTNLDDFALQNLSASVESNLNLINDYARNLNLLLERENKMGADGKSNIPLQSEIRLVRMNTVKLLEEIANQLYQAYGVRVTTPEQLVDLLESQ